MSTEKRQITIALTGPTTMLESMASALRDEGYTVLPPGSSEPNPERTLNSVVEEMMDLAARAGYRARGDLTRPRRKKVKP